MAIEHHWLSTDTLHTRYLGDVSGAELIQAAREVGEDRRMEDVRFIIGDWSLIGNAQISADDVRELAAYIVALAKSFPRVKNASVVANYESGVARASLYGLLLEDTKWQTATFATVEEALTWFETFR